MLWEYHAIPVKARPPKVLEVDLNALAQDGWEPIVLYEGSPIVLRRCARCKGTGRLPIPAGEWRGNRCPSGCPE